MKKILILWLSAFLLSACATQTGYDLKNKKGYDPLSWTVNSSLDHVYKEYRDYAEKNLSGGDFLWSGGLRVRGDFYGINEGADLSVKMEGNPLAPITYLHFEFSKAETGTNVQVWYYNNRWKKNAEKFREELF